jgi:Spy/CpxP family protein refolding chaperone
MKTFINSLKALTLLAVLFLATQASAQDAPSQPGRMAANKEQREQRFQEASKRLGLTSDQQSKIRTILDNSRAEMKAAREANKTKEISREAKREAMLEHMKKTDAQIKAVLDTKQQGIYEQMKAEKRAALKQKREEHMKQQDDLDGAVNVF